MTVTKSRSFLDHHRPSADSKDEWLTPPEIVKALGPFDLDPCSPINRPWDTAKRHLTIEDDGLATEWLSDDFVWLNPPYGRETFTWLDKLANHPGGGIALIFARTDTVGFHRSVWNRNRCTGLLFLKGRLTFRHVDGSKAAGNSGAPSVLVAYGPKARNRLANASVVGHRKIDGAYIPFHERP